MQKEMTMDVVGIIVDWAMLDQGNITTLEIKNYLRSKGYWARQKDVSAMLTQYVDQFVVNGCTYELGDRECTINVKDDVTNGVTHRVYYLVDVNQPAVSVPVTPPPVVPAGSYTTIAQVIAAYPGVKSNVIAALCQAAGISTTDYQVRGVKASLNR